MGRGAEFYQMSFLASSQGHKGSGLQKGHSSPTWPCLHPLPHHFAVPSIKRQGYFCTLSLGWPCDLPWPIEWGKVTDRPLEVCVRWFSIWDQATTMWISPGQPSRGWEPYGPVTHHLSQQPAHLPLPCELTRASLLEDESHITTVTPANSQLVYH